MNINEIVNGENLKALADLIIDSDRLGEKREYKSGQIVFCKTDLLNILHAETETFCGEITLITHLSDYPINEQIYSNRPACVKKWFAQNTNHKNKNLIPIPIGIENHKGPSKGTCIDELFIVNELDELADYTKSNAIYVNFADTHPNRKDKRSALKTNPKADFASHKSYKEYFKDLARRKYVASPRGNGIDCHRTWEALLVGSIPIVDKHFMYDAWNIPVIQVTDWNNLELKIPENCSTDALYMGYWRKQIRG